MNKKEKREFRDNVSFQDDLGEDDNERIRSDLSLVDRKNYPSESVPQDFFQFKLQRMNPDASADFRGSIDKDWVLANIGGKKPNLSELSFKLGTHTLIKSVFVVDKVIPLLDSNGEQVVSGGKPLFFEGTVFDDTFQPVLDYVLGDIKSLLVGSRAIGGDREAVLLEQQGFKKVVERRKEQQGKVFGLGGA
jgi:hypothetical protein